VSDQVALTEQRAPAQLLRRLAVEDFLYREAALLDDWRLDDWLELFTEDCRYAVPATEIGATSVAMTVANGKVVSGDE